MKEDSAGRAGDRPAGIAMAAAAAGTILAMAHHPSGAHAGGLGGLVHGAMILFLAVLAWGFVTFAVRRGGARPLVLAGLVAYGLGVFAHVGAATINGFVVPALAARGHGAVVGHDIFLFAWEANQALARLGVYATGAAFILWGADLLRGPAGETRAVGALGLLAGAVPAALLATGTIGMNVAGAFTVYAAHAAWAALVGLQLIRGRVDG
jgi:hypothetical protein